MPGPPPRGSGQTALITGASRGLGLLLARELGRLGCRVAICARTPGDLDWARQRLEAEGIRVFAEACDVSRRDQVDRFVEHARAELGPIHILVNNAGIMDVGPVQHMSVEDFEDALGVMFWGGVYTSLAVYPEMIACGGGHIVNITSIGGIVSVPHLLPYCSAKFAAVGFSKGLGAELARYNVKVLTVAPGLMRTGSYVNARVRSRQKAEMAWFGLGASLPLISMDAERAAVRIVRAMLRGRSHLTLSVPAKLLALAHGVFPGVTSSVLGLANQLILPPPGGSGASAARAGDVQARANSRLLDFATAWGRAAAARFQPERHQDEGEQRS